MLKAGLVNPFVESAYKFLQEEVNMEVTRGQLRLETSKATSGEINVALGVAGDAEGIVIYSMSEKTAKAIASALLDDVVPVFNELAESSIAEMGNIITGQAAAGLGTRVYLQAHSTDHHRRERCNDIDRGHPAIGHPDRASRRTHRDLGGFALLQAEITRGRPARTRRLTIRRHPLLRNNHWTRCSYIGKSGTRAGVFPSIREGSFSMPSRSIGV